MMKFKDMVDSGYFMYMAEAEGHDKLVNTRTAKINAVIKDLQYVLERNGINAFVWKIKQDKWCFFSPFVLFF